MMKSPIFWLLVGWLASLIVSPSFLMSMVGGLTSKGA